MSLTICDAWGVIGTHSASHPALPTIVSAVVARPNAVFWAVEEMRCIPAVYRYTARSPRPAPLANKQTKNIPHDTRPCYEPWLGRALGLLHDVPGYKGLPPPTTTRNVCRPMSVGGVGMDPRPKHVDPANGDHARVRGSSLPYLIPLSGAIASATPPGRCGREAEETWVPSRFSLTAPLPEGVGRGLFRPPPAGSRAGGGLGLSRVHCKPY